MSADDVSTDAKAISIQEIKDLQSTHDVNYDKLGRI